ncbi:MAG TPA: MBL fold metallo-hydrolase [Nannocystaceae bacterium]|nr:MBL fold metallo-hydrolase [Nannocystaceae bacterium]
MAQLYLRQLLSGRDFGRGDAMASGMQNFVYLVGDRDAKECMVVDPAWDIAGIVAAAEADDMKITGALVTHYHPDHVGGSMFGFDIEGLAELNARCSCKAHVHALESEGVRAVTGLSKTDLVEHRSGDKVQVGGIEIELLHTPGHTPGSQCFRVAGLTHGEEEALLAGDTLFLQGCGRVDLPGGNAEQMYRTLSERLATLPGETILLPGHAYGGERASLAHVRKTNSTLQLTSLQQFMRRMGG